MEFGDNGEFTLDHGLNTNTHIKHTGAGDMYIQSVNDILLRNNTTADKYAHFKEDGAVELYYNNIRTLFTDPNGAVVMGPEGGSGNLYLYGDEGDDNNDKFAFVAFAGELSIQNYTSGSWENSIKCNGDGNVELYHDGDKRLETSTNGIKVSRTTTYSDSNFTSDQGSGLVSRLTLGTTAAPAKLSIMYHNDTERATIWTEGSFPLVLGSAGTERVRILSSGGMTFNGDTAAANALDDYEEGTWTFSFGGSSSNPSYNVQSSTCTYTKIGNVVHFSGDISFNNWVDGSGYLLWKGLPFASKASSYSGFAILTYANGLDNNSGDGLPYASYLITNSSNFYINQGDSNTAPINTDQVATGYSCHFIFHGTYTTD